MNYKTDPARIPTAGLFTIWKLRFRAKVFRSSVLRVRFLKYPHCRGGVQESELEGRRTPKRRKILGESGERSKYTYNPYMPYKSTGYRILT